MKHKKLRWWTPLLILLFLPGCSRGLLYTHIVQPLDVNLHQTSQPLGGNKGDIKRFQVPLISPSIDFAWDTNAIGEIAKRSGMESAEYADLEIFSILLGLWRQYTVHVYGRVAGEFRHLEAKIP